MANSKSSTEATQRAMSLVDVAPLHKPFSWLPVRLEEDAGAQFAASVKDIAAGARVIAQVTRSHVLDLHHLADGSTGVTPLMSPTDMDALAGLAAVALEDLYDLASARVEAIEEGRA